MDNSQVEPVFFKDNDYKDQPQLTSFEVCIAVGHVIGSSSVDGAQNIRGVWHIYTKSRASRLELLMRKELLIKKQKLLLYDGNPFATRANETSEKITIKDVPLSIANTEIEAFLLSKEIILTSPIKYSKIRDQDGIFTNYKNGDRFVYAKAPITLDRNVKIGDHRARVFYSGQFLNCKICGLPGHKPGTPACDAYDPDADVISFRSESQPLSNFFPCSFTYEGQEFTSSEQAIQYLKAKDTENHHVAKKVLAAQDARSAWTASRAIPSETSLQWDQNNIHQVEQVLSAKAEQVPAFKDALINSGQSVLAEATSHTFWATGITSPDLAKSTKQQYWTGQNKLGQILMELRQWLQEKEAESHLDVSDSQEETLTEELNSSCSGESENENKENEKKSLKKRTKLQPRMVVSLPLWNASADQHEHHHLQRQRKRP